MTRPTLLLTRPEAQSRRFAEAFRQRFGDDWPVVLSPLTGIRTLPLPKRLPDAPTVIFTSESGVEAVAGRDDLAGRSAWCVGQRTAAAARAAGFATRTGPGDGEGLARAMVAAGVAGPCLYLRGTHVAADLASALDSAGIETLSLVVYDQTDLPLTQAAGALLAQDRSVLVPLFSPRSARLLSMQAPPETRRAALFVAAMSRAVAEAAASLSPARIEVAEQPDAPAMIAALGRLVDAHGLKDGPDGH